MAVNDHERIPCLRVLVEALRQQHMRSQVQEPAPERGKRFALDLDVADVLRVFGLRDRRDLLVQRDRDAVRLGGIEVNLTRCAVEVAGCGAPRLPFAPVHRQFHGVTGSQVEHLILVEHGLDVILTRG